MDLLKFHKDQTYNYIDKLIVVIKNYIKAGLTKKAISKKLETEYTDEDIYLAYKAAEILADT